MSNRETIVREYITAYNSFDTEGMVKNLDEKIEFINEFRGDVTMTTNSADEFKGQAEHAKNYFQFREIKIEDLTEKDDTVTISTTFTAGMIVEKAPGMPAKIQNVDMKGTSIFYFQDEKIVKLRDIY